MNTIGYTNYLKIRPDLKTGDMIETALNAPISRLIRFITKKDVSHTAFVWRTWGYYTTQDAVFIIEAIKGGLDITLLSDVIKYIDGKVYWYPLEDVSLAQRDQMGGYALRECAHKSKLKKKKYDTSSLILNAIKRVSIDADKWFCSEFYQQVLCEHGIIDDCEIAKRPGEIHLLGKHGDRVLLNHGG
jgi:hypothetical protein